MARRLGAAPKQLRLGERGARQEACASVTGCQSSGSSLSLKLQATREACIVCGSRLGLRDFLSRSRALPVPTFIHPAPQRYCKSHPARDLIAIALEEAGAERSLSMRVRPARRGSYDGALGFRLLLLKVS
jgi:hypothetical protein